MWVPGINDLSRSRSPVEINAAAQDVVCEIITRSQSTRTFHERAQVLVLMSGMPLDRQRAFVKSFRLVTHGIANELTLRNKAGNLL